MEGARDEDVTLKKMEVIMKVILRTMWLMVMENILIDQDTNMKANGRIIRQMAREKLFIQIKAVTMVSF